MRFRWEIILVPLTILALAWLSNAVRCTLDFRDLFLTHGRLMLERYLVLLGLAVVGVLLAVKHGMKR
jgi:hypothetical protein